VAVKRDAFVANGIRIETARDWTSRWFVCWKPNVSIYCRTRKEVLKFAAWPVKTPTGDSLRSWLDGLEQMDAERTSNLTKTRSSLGAEPLTSEAPIEQTSPSLSQELLATGFGPEVFSGELDDSDPNYATRVIT